MRIRATAFRRALFALIVASFVGACVTTPAASRIGTRALEASFVETIEAGYLNEHISLEVIKKPSLQNATTTAEIMIRNVSDEPIRFESDYGVHVFASNQDANSWILVENRVEYLGDGEVLEPKSGELANWFTVLSISPDKNELTEGATIRIYVEGTLSSQEKLGNRTGAFVDVTLDVFD